MAVTIPPSFIDFINGQQYSSNKFNYFLAVFDYIKGGHHESHAPFFGKKEIETYFVESLVGKTPLEILQALVAAFPAQRAMFPLVVLHMGDVTLLQDIMRETELFSADNFNAAMSLLYRNVVSKTRDGHHVFDGCSSEFWQSHIVPAVKSVIEAIDERGFDEDERIRDELLQSFINNLLQYLINKGSFSLLGDFCDRLEIDLVAKVTDSFDQPFNMPNYLMILLNEKTCLSLPEQVKIFKHLSTVSTLDRISDDNLHKVAERLQAAIKALPEAAPVALVAASSQAAAASAAGMFATAAARVDKDTLVLQFNTALDKISKARPDVDFSDLTVVPSIAPIA